MKGSGFVRRCSSAPPAVILGAEGGVALGIVRDLGREGVPVVAVGRDANDAAMRSRYCVPERWALNQHHDEGVLADLVSVGARIGRRAVLFAAEDDYVAAVSRHKTLLEEHFIIPVLSWDRMRLLVDKEEQLKLARGAGIEIPPTAVIRSSEDLAKAADAVTFPGILKAAGANMLRMRTGLKVIRVHTRDDLETAYERISFCGTVLLQEEIPGPDDAVLLAGTYHDADSRPQAVFTGRKLRQHPRGFGNTRAGESLWSDELADATLELLAAVPYHGLSDVEFKRDARDGRLKFMEINARQGLWSPLARAAGVNLAYIAYRDSIGRPCPTPRQIDGVRWTDMLMDGPDSLKELWRGELRPAEWMASLRGLRVDCFLSARDPLPGLVQVKHVVKSHVRRRLGRDRGRPSSDLVPGTEKSLRDDGRQGG
jgi:D-aspartate ligase